MIKDSNEALKSKAIYDESWVTKTESDVSAFYIWLIVGAFLVVIGGVGLPTIILPIICLPLGILCLLIGLALAIATQFGYDPKAENEEKGAWIGPCPKCEDQVVLHLRKEVVTTNTFRCKTCNILITFYDGKFSFKEPD